jgi:hypothetical protein
VHGISRLELLVDVGVSYSDESSEETRLGSLPPMEDLVLSQKANS